MPIGALEGVKVVEFANALVGPITAKQLADYGATVVRLESPLRPDPTRTSAPYKDNRPGVDRSGFYAYFNGNKLSMALDLNHPKGLETAKRLIAWTDVTIENFRPGVMEKWGLSYEAMKEINPGVIMLRTSNQGQTGPYSRMPGVGNGLNGLLGLVHLSGWPDRPPSVMMLAYTDYVTPLFGATAVMAALDQRRSSGRGQLIDMSQFEAGLQFFLPMLLDASVNGVAMGRKGNESPCAAPHGAYRCKGHDRWCAIAVSTEEEWRAFCRAIGNPPWTEEERFSTLAGRKEHEAELNGLVEGWTGAFEAGEVMEMLQAAGVPSGIVQGARDVASDPQLAHRNFLWEMEHREMGPFRHLGQASILSKTPARGRMAAPCLGEHTELVCRELLKMSEAEYDSLLIDGAFGWK